MVIERNYIDVMLKMSLAKKLNECACKFNKMDKPFNQYVNLDSIKLANFFKDVYEKFAKDVPDINIREMTKTTSLSNLAFYIENQLNKGSNVQN